MTWNAAISIVAIAGAGCSWGAAPSPVVGRVEPGRVTGGAAAILTLDVTGLDAFGEVDFDDPGQSAVCDYYRVEVSAPGGDAVPLEDVVRVSATELRGRFIAPSPDVYDVIVIDPRGHAAALRAALEVERCGLPGEECRDENLCTGPDACHDANRCEAGPSRPNGMRCNLPCTWGSVQGTCLDGQCSAPPGSCPPPTPPCTLP